MRYEDDPAFLRGVTEARFSRRRLLRAAGAGAAGAGMIGFLDACGIAGTRGTGAENVNWSVFWAQQHKAGVLDWANWPLYIDSAHGGDHPSIDLFSRQTGTTVNYRAVIQDNPSFFAQISPVLQAGQSIGYDLIVISDGWELTQLIQNRWLIPLDQSRMPNFHRHAGSIARDPPFDPGNRYTASWQSGLTGIAYDPRMTGHEITSVKDLWDPAFKGKVPASSGRRYAATRSSRWRWRARGASSPPQSASSIRAGSVAAMKSASASARPSGSSRCGKWAARGRVAKRLPGIARCVQRPCSIGIVWSCSPHTIRVGKPPRR